MLKDSSQESSRNLHRTTRTASKATILVALLFLSPLLAGIPVATDEENPMPSSTRQMGPDVVVTDLDVTTPSATVGGTPTLAPVDHVIVVGTTNQGGSTAEGNVTLKVNGVVVDNRTATITPGGQVNSVMYWDASSLSGTGYEITASWIPASSSSDSDSSNNQMSLSGVSVAEVESASDIADSLPSDGSSLARALWEGAITVVNTGNQPVDVTAQLTLTPSLGGSSVPLSSSTEELLPGSLADPPTPANITISFDGSGLEGDYTLSGSILVSGSTQGSVTIDSRIVSFVALRASLIPANNRNVDPGSQATLNFILQNSGTVEDNFTVTQSNNSDPANYWVNITDQIHSSTNLLNVGAQQTHAIQIPVDVPADAANGDAVIVTLTIQSDTAGYVLSASTMVMAGGTFSAEIFQNHSHSMGENFANITPGSPRTLQYTLMNTGTAPAQYQIDVGATESVPYWIIDSPVTITDVLLPNETRTLPVTITTPELEMPLNPSWKVSSIERVDLMVQAIPLQGGVPAVNQTTLMIDSIVELDISVTSEIDDISVNDIIGGNTDRFVGFEVTIVHNLGSNNTLAQVSLSAMPCTSLAPTTAASGSPWTQSTCSNGKVFLQDTPAGSSLIENSRWTATVQTSSSSSASTLELLPGETGYGMVGLSFGPTPDFQYPSAGHLNFSFMATSSWAAFSGAISRNATATVSMSIAELWSAELTSSGAANGDPGTPISSEVVLENTGNDPANFTIGYVPKPGWTITLGSTAANLVPSMTNLYNDGSSTQNQRPITVTATPPASARADETHQVWVYANSTETGELLAYAPALFTLTEVISAELYPPTSTAVITPSPSLDSRVGQKTLIALLNNTGNKNVTYNLSLDNLDVDKIRVCFSEEMQPCVTESTLLVPAGSQGIVRIYSTAGEDSRADENQTFFLNASHDGQLMSTSEWKVQVAPDHAILFIAPTEMQVAPGNTLDLEVVLRNDGNLMETLNLTVTFPEGMTNWSYQVNESGFSLDQYESRTVLLSITLPPLRDGDQILVADVIHNLTMRAVNITDPFPTWPATKMVDGVAQPVPLSERVAMGGGVPAGTSTLKIKVLPVFDVELTKSPQRIAIVPGVDRSIEFEMENKGNAPINLTIQWETIDTEQDDSKPDRFEVRNSLGSTNLYLQVGQTSSISFEFAMTHNDTIKGEQGTFILKRVPVDAAMETQQNSFPITVVRAQTDDTYTLSADAAGQYQCENNDDPNCRQIEIPWVDINYRDSSFDPRSYTLALNGDMDPYDASADPPERLVDSASYPKVHWWLYIDHDTDAGTAKCELADIDGFGIAATDATEETCNSDWELDATTPYEGGSPDSAHGGTIVLQVIIPEKQLDGVAAGDGWNIYLQLRHPEEPKTTEYSTDLVVRLRMTESTDPLVNSITFRGEGVEGESTWIDVTVINAGYAVMPTQSQLNLDCTPTPYADVTNMFASYPIPALEANGNFTASWAVELNPIPWYKSSETLTCSASITYPDIIMQMGGIFGNVVENDVRTEDLSIDSWSTPAVELSGLQLPSALLIAALLLLLAVSLIRQGLEEQESRLHASSYVAAMAFGALSLTGASTILSLLCALASILFAGLVAWLSSSELQAIHDDRKKARIGTMALLEDHDKEQQNTRNELRAIISCSPYAFLPFVLISPSLAIDLGASSLISIIGFMIASPILVHIILKFLDSSYDRLYSELADIELRAIRIKKILGRAGQKPGGRN